MRRADRLFRLVQMLRRGRVQTAQHLAERLEVSVRTVYRDVADLLASGVPIEGEAGVGYRLRHFDLPPLMFTHDEIEALVLGARIVEGWADPELAMAARGVLAKVEAAVPGDADHWMRSTPLFAPKEHRGRRPGPELSLLRRALRARQRVSFSYVDEKGAASERTVRPLALAFYGAVWTLAAWCELRQAFRVFRLDRLVETEVGAEVPLEGGRNLEDFMAAMDAQMEVDLAAQAPYPAHAAS